MGIPPINKVFVIENEHILHCLLSHIEIITGIERMIPTLLVIEARVTMITANKTRFNLYSQLSGFTKHEA